jgi:hypothetical protein
MGRISAVRQASASISNPFRKSGTRFRKKQSSDELIRCWPSVEVASFSLRFRGHYIARAMFRHFSVIGALVIRLACARHDARLQPLLTVQPAKLLVVHDGALAPEQHVESPIGFMPISQVMASTHFWRSGRAQLRSRSPSGQLILLKPSEKLRHDIGSLAPYTPRARRLAGVRR